MKLDLPDRTIDVFTISPRTTDESLYWKNIKNTIKLSEEHNYSGNLIFTGNDIYVDTWLVANTVFSDTKTLSPLVAVNPIYMHPFSAAKMISSFAYIFGRKTFVNCVTGTSKNDLVALDDSIEHDNRYDRLREYIEVVKLLLKGEPVSFTGNYYKIQDLQLLPKIPDDLFPEFYVAGASGAAKAAAEQIGAVLMVMAKPFERNFNEYPSFVKQEGVYLGIIAREKKEDAWKFANDYFPDNEEGEMMLNISMNNTDSVWKKELAELSEKGSSGDKRYWMKPFKAFQADCPYYVGDYEQIADVIFSHIAAGMKSIIIDTPSSEEEYGHISKAFKIAKEKLIRLYNENVSKNSINVEFNF